MSDTALNYILSQGTAADRVAFTPSPPTVASGPDLGYLWFETDTGSLYGWNSAGSSWSLLTSGGGASAFTDLTDVPASYSGAASKAVAVNAAANALEFVARPAEELIAESSPSGVGTVTFSSIPTTFRDLILVVRGAGTKAAAFVEVRVQLNGDTGANYDFQNLTMNNGSNTSAGNVAQVSLFGGWLPAASGGVASASSMSEMTIYNYKDTTFHKAVSSRGGVRTGAAATNTFINETWGDWRNTAAVTSVTAFLDANNFVAGSVVSLYGRR